MTWTGNALLRMKQTIILLVEKKIVADTLNQITKNHSVLLYIGLIIKT